MLFVLLIRRSLVRAQVEEPKNWTPKCENAWGFRLYDFNLSPCSATLWQRLSIPLAARQCFGCGFGARFGGAHPKKHDTVHDE
jgi:hypothetical protein